MANIYILDNIDPFNNGGLAMVLGFRDGLRQVCGDKHSVTVVLYNARRFKESSQRYAHFGVNSIPSGLARWVWGPYK